MHKRPSPAPSPCVTLRSRLIPLASLHTSPFPLLPPSPPFPAIPLIPPLPQAHVTVDQNYPEGAPRKIIIQGRPDACQKAAVMIRELINGEPGSAQAIIQRVCAEVRGGLRWVGRSSMRMQQPVLLLLPLLRCAVC